MPEFMRHDLVWQVGDSIPYVVTRQLVGDSTNLQVARSLSADKSILSRQSYNLLPKSIIRHKRPLALKQLLTSSIGNKLATTENLAKVFQLLKSLESNNLILRCYGSFSWSFYTNIDHTTGDSDLDLICYVDSFDKLDKLNNALNQLTELLNYPLDGELVFFSRFFVAYQEWFNYTNQQLLVKTNTLVKLCSRVELLNYDMSAGSS